MLHYRSLFRDSATLRDMLFIEVFLRLNPTGFMVFKGRIIFIFKLYLSF